MGAPSRTGYSPKGGATSSTVSPAKPSNPSAALSPSPWDTNVKRLSDGSICVAHIVSKDGYSVAQLATYGEEQTVSNARLIAAAPDGYETAGAFIMAAINEWDIPESREADEGWLCDTLGHALANAFLKAQAFRAKARGEVA